MIRYNKIKNPQPYTLYTAYAVNICQRILVDTRGQGDVITLESAEVGDWQRLFRNCELPPDAQGWMSNRLVLNRIGRDRGGLQPWTRINDRRGSRPAWQFAILMTHSPGARIETENWVAEPKQGQIAIYSVADRYRLLGSRSHHTVYLTGTLQANEDNGQ